MKAIYKQVPMNYMLTFHKIVFEMENVSVFRPTPVDAKTHPNP